MISPLLSLLLAVSIRTPTQLNAFKWTTYAFCVGFALAGILVAAVWSLLIKYEGGSHPRDPGKRRFVFWSFWLLSVAGAFSFCSFYEAAKVALNLKAKYMTITLVGTAITLVLYLAAGLIISKVLARKGKLASWMFPAKHR